MVYMIALNLVPRDEYMSQLLKRVRYIMDNDISILSSMCKMYTIFI